LVFLIYGGGFTEQIKTYVEEYLPVFESPEEAAKALSFLLRLKRNNWI